MLKNKILGIVNIPIVLYFIFGFLTFVQEYFENWFEINLGYVLALVFILILLSIHLFVIYKMLIEKDTKLSFFFYLFLSFCPTFYAVLFIGGYYLATSIVFQICFLILIAIIYYSYKSYSQKLALILSLLALFTMIVSFKSGFKDEFCAEQASITAPDDIKDAFISATKEDAELLYPYLKTKEGDSIAIYFRDKIKCENNFKLFEVIKGNY